MALVYFYYTYSLEHTPYNFVLTDVSEGLPIPQRKWGVSHKLGHERFLPHIIALFILRRYIISDV
jgi:hypothetical protein